MLKLNKILILFLSAISLSACANQTFQPTPMAYQPAMSSAQLATMPVDLSTRPSIKTIAPIDRKVSRNHKGLQGIKAVKAANKKATHSPKSSGYVDSIMTFNYTPGALYEIYCAPLTVTDIQFQSGEKIVAVAAGDTLRWQVSKTFSGTETAKVEHLVVKPTDKGLTNSMVITTDQRTYHMLLRSTAATYMPIVRWHYPQGNLMADIGNSQAQAAEQQLDSLSHGLDINHMDFNYRAKLIKGPQPEWYPTLVFNDGNKTYIRLPNKIQEAPTLFIGSSVRNGQIVNYRTVGNYYIVDSLFPEAQLRAGQNNQIIVQISYVRR